MKQGIPLKHLRSWVAEVVDGLPSFLGRLEGNREGYYRYSLDGDLYGEQTTWGLGQAVFAAKLLFMLNREDLFAVKREGLGRFVLSFAREGGEISDPLIERLTRLYRLRYALQSGDCQNLFNAQTRRAETRQAFSALFHLGIVPPHPYRPVPLRAESLRGFLQRLDWTAPWGAASHFGHLMFFLRAEKDAARMTAEEYRVIREEALAELKGLRNSDGFWYRQNDPGLTQRVNGAMKVFTGLDCIDACSIVTEPEKLIDGCLALGGSDSACDNFNVVCVLYHCHKLTGYRWNETEEFLVRQLQVYRDHYFPATGGFSFYRGGGHSRYYGARICRDSGGPDIHGTALFFWGVVIINEILRMGFPLRNHRP